MRVRGALVSKVATGCGWSRVAFATRWRSRAACNRGRSAARAPRPAPVATYRADSRTASMRACAISSASGAGDELGKYSIGVASSRIDSRFFAVSRRRTFMAVSTAMRQAKWSTEHSPRCRGNASISANALSCATSSRSGCCAPRTRRTTRSRCGPTVTSNVRIARRSPMTAPSAIAAERIRCRIDDESEIGRHRVSRPVTSDSTTGHGLRRSTILHVCDADKREHGLPPTPTSRRSRVRTAQAAARLVSDRDGCAENVSAAPRSTRSPRSFASRRRRRGRAGRV